MQTIEEMEVDELSKMIMIEKLAWHKKMTRDGEDSNYVMLCDLNYENYEDEETKHRAINNYYKKEDHIALHEPLITPFEMEMARMKSFSDRLNKVFSNINIDDIDFWSKININLLKNLPEYIIGKWVVKWLTASWNILESQQFWQHWWNQIKRSSSSILLNAAEAFGKGRGHFFNYYLIARGEAFETAINLEIGPPEICTQEVKDHMLSLVETMNVRIHSANYKTIKPTINSFEWIRKELEKIPTTYSTTLNGLT